jgi:hypothetical protein
MCPSAGEKELPNIIIIFADDMGYGDVSFFNPDSRVQTPAIDYLAETDWHLQMPTPVALYAPRQGMAC